MRILVAPDKFRGTLTAGQAARAIETGWLRVRPHDEVEAIPMADGGEGTLDALVEALGGEQVLGSVSGPLGERIEAPFGLAPADEGLVAIVEAARASGLALLAPERRRPLEAGSRGTGELIRRALERGPARVIVCVGGVASTDGGAGIGQALGAGLVTASGQTIPPGGKGLLALAHIDLSGLDPRIATTRFVLASDVDNPLTGPSGSAHVYAPQKGATPDDVRLLDRALGHLAAIVHRDLGVDLRDAPGAGAAGGLGFGLMAFCGARRRPGIDVVMEAVRLQERLKVADLVITGEGKLDGQSLHGKTPDGVLRVARESGVRVAIVCGRADIEVPGVPVHALVNRFGVERALGDTRRALEDLAAELAASAEAPGSR